MENFSLIRKQYSIPFAMPLLYLIEHIYNQGHNILLCQGLMRPEEILEN